MKTIGILIERQRAFGRRLCQGVVRFAEERRDWSLRMIEFSQLEHTLRRNDYDGFVTRVMNESIAESLQRTGRPVVDVFFERPIAGFAAADQDALAVGQMAARHFIEHRFANFAFCGYNGRRYSDGRRDSFVRCLRLNHFDCHCYSTPRMALKDFEGSAVMYEHFGPPPDKRQLLKWLKDLPKPVAILCAHDMRAYQVSEICRTNGIRVPDEVAILGVDDDELVCNFTYPPISSIDQNPCGIGYAAAATLQRIFDDPGIKPPVVRVKPAKLVERGSTSIYPINPAWLSDALVFIRANISKRISAADVYAHVGKSHTLVDSAFKSKLGTSVQKAIARTRLEEAKRLLDSTSMPIQRIASACGYSSLQYFSTSFSEAFGKSPTSFRA